MFSLLKLFCLGLCFSFLTISSVPVNAQSTFIENTTKKESIPANMPKELFDDTPLVPTKVFDNLFCIGSRSVVAWALQTTDGIILIDSMWDNHDAQTIIDGLQELGLDPSQIKYILITHGHGDHYGGAQFLKDKYHAKILMSATDFKFMNSLSTGANGPRSPKCSVDEFLSDGDQLTLGNTTIDIISTPGHTPGCISLLYPVRQNGKTLMAAQWGGTGLPSTLEEKLAYRKSIDHFAQGAQKENATVEITAHLFSENGYQKLEACRKQTAGQINPFDLGKDGFTNYLDSLRKSADEAIALSK